jgi:hypothetical protein
MRWATRRHCHIDRACALLIRRWIDPEAKFLFVDDPDEVPAGATPFDMRGVELSHHGGDCSFETFLRRYELADPVLWEIAKVVHEADLADERYDAPAAAGIDILLRGLSMVRDDDELLALSGPLFDGLYEYRKRALLTGRQAETPRNPTRGERDEVGNARTTEDRPNRLPLADPQLHRPGGGVPLRAGRPSARGRRTGDGAFI